MHEKRSMRLADGAVGKAALVAAVGTAFVLVFTASHLVHASQKEELCNEGYFATLTVWTLIATAYVLVARGPPAVAAAVLAVNVLVCALYYGMVNQKSVSGTSFLLHGGCALVLLAVVGSGATASGVPPARSSAAAAIVALVFLSANSLLQMWHERQLETPLYPSVGSFQHPAWRLLVIPGAGALLAAAIAAV